jgi:hypothetical protein
VLQIAWAFGEFSQSVVGRATGLILAWRAMVKKLIGALAFGFDPETF